jgi:hypothetical protein
MQVCDTDTNVDKLAMGEKRWRKRGQIRERITLINTNGVCVDVEGTWRPRARGEN